MASSQSLSMIHLRISLMPDPASPEKSGEPLNTMAIRLPPSFRERIFEIICWRKRTVHRRSRAAQHRSGPKSQAVRSPP